LSEQGGEGVWGQGGKAGCVPFGFRYAKHFDEPLKREPVGYQPSCFPGLISQAKIHPPCTQSAFPPLTGITTTFAFACSLNNTHNMTNLKSQFIRA